MPKFILCFGILIFVFSCQNSKVVSQSPSTSVSFEVLFNSEYGGLGIDQIQVIDNNKDWSMLWQELTSQSAEATLTLNFKNFMVIRKDFQSRNMGGNQYTIESVKINNNKIDVAYSVSSSEIGTDAITNPLILIKMEKVENPEIKFNLTY